MLPRVAKERLASFADVFCEPGVFTVDESREILTAARAAGLRLKLHADELTSSGGARARRGARRDLGGPPGGDLARLASPRSPPLGPSRRSFPRRCCFSASRDQAPARRLIEAGAAGRARDGLQSRHLADDQLSARADAGRQPAPARVRRRSIVAANGEWRGRSRACGSRRPADGRAISADLALFDISDVSRTAVLARRPSFAARSWTRGKACHSMT